MSISGVPDEFEELMPCSACPDGYVWDSNGPTCKPCPVCKGHAAVDYRAAQTEQTSGSTEGRAAIGMEPAEAMPECVAMASPTAGIKPGPLYQQSAAGTNCAAECAVRAPESFARGPAADPIADLCDRLRGFNPPDRTIDEQRQAAAIIYEAADALERLARERDEARAMLQSANRDAAKLAHLVDKYKWQVRDTCTRAERAEAERDALREVVRAADAMRAREHAHDGKTRGCVACSVIAAYDERRAKWKDNT